MCAMIHDPQTPAQAFRLRRCAVRHALGVGTTSPLNFSLPAFSPYSEVSKVPVTRFPSTSSVITVSVFESAIFERRGAGGNTQACGQQDRENESKLHVLTKNRSEA